MKYKSIYFSRDKKRWCSCGCGMDMQPFALKKFDLAREHAGIPFNVNSGARCPKYNKKIGGAASSAHTRGTAFDIRFDNDISLIRIIYGLSKADFHRIGINMQKKFIHADCDLELPSPAFFTY